MFENVVCEMLSISSQPLCVKVATGNCLILWYRETYKDMVMTKSEFRMYTNMYLIGYSMVALWWRHNGHDGVSNHQPDDCLLNRLFGRWSK